MEAFLSNKEILPFVLTADVEVREEQMQKKIPGKIRAFWSREPVDVLLLLRRKSTFSFRKGTNIKHGPFSSVVEHGRKRGNGPEIYNKLTRIRGRYVDGKLEGEKEETFYFLKRKEKYMLCGTTTTTYRRGVKHGMQSVKLSDGSVITRMYQNGEKVKEAKQ